MLDADAIVERRARPTELALILAGTPPRPSRPEIVGPLPAVLRAEYRTELLQAPVQRAQPLRPAGLGHVVRVAQAVVVLVDLARRRSREVRVAVGAAEAPRPVRLHVDLRLAGRHELGERLAETPGAAESVQGEACGGPDPTHPGRRAEQWIAVGRHRVGMADERDDPGLVEEREPPRGAVHQLLEARMVGREGALAVLPRHAVLPPRDRVRLVAAKQHAADLSLAVDEIVRIPEARHGARQLVSFDRVQRDVLVIDRDRARERSHHPRDPWRPHARRVDDGVGLDPTVLRQHRADLALRAELDPRHECLRAYLRAELSRGRRERERGDVRVDIPVVRHPHRAVERLRARDRHQPAHVLRTDELGIEPDPVGAADAAPQLEEALRARREPKASHRLEDSELVVELDAVTAKAHHRRRRVELRDEPCGVVRRPARELALLEQQNLLHPRLREVVRAADAGDAAADHDDAHARASSDVQATIRVRSPRKTSRAVSTASPSSS